MKRGLWALVGAAVAAAVIGGSGFAKAKPKPKPLKANPNVLVATMTSLQEVPTLAGAGSGTFRATVSGGSISYTETFSGLSSDASASHIHIGAPGVNGGVFAFLCGGGGKPACPAAGGTVTGTIAASDILAVSAQGLAAGDMATALRLLRGQAAYVNVHTHNFAGGEIRGVLKQALTR
jgi:CHRD domain-containing protein